jgi:integrase
MQKKSRGLRVVLRDGAPTLSGTLYKRNADGTETPHRVQLRATDRGRATLEEAIDDAWEEAAEFTVAFNKKYRHGDPDSGPVNWTLADAIEKYLDEEERSVETKDRLERLKLAIGKDTRLADINQDTITALKKDAFAGRAEQTILRACITPLSAVLKVAEERDMIQKVPKFKRPKKPKGRVAFLMPDEAERMIEAAAPHFKPLLTFLFCCGPRESEAVYLEWRDVNLKGAAATVWGDRTKAGTDRHIDLPPRAVAALANLPLPHTGRVFLKPNGEGYAINQGKDGRKHGGQLKKAWAGAKKRAGIEGKEYVVHSTRHTWASWHYALYRDIKKLREDGGWSEKDATSALSYTHPMLRGHEQAICNFLGIDIRSLAIQLPVPLIANDDVKEVV